MKRYVLSVAVAGMLLIGGGLTAQGTEFQTERISVQAQDQQQDEFEPVDEKDVPDAIKEAVEKTGSEMGDVSKNDEGIYKVEVKDVSGENQELLFTKDGKPVNKDGEQVNEEEDVS